MNPDPKRRRPSRPLPVTPVIVLCQNTPSAVVVPVICSGFYSRPRLRKRVLDQTA